MKNLKNLQAALLVFAFTALASTSAHAATSFDVTALTAGLAELESIASQIIVGLIAFAITWMVGRKVYGMIKNG